MLINTGNFCAAEKYAEKQNLASALGIQKKIGVTVQFSEIMKLQFGK